MGFDARLKWVDGDASLAPRRRGKRRFGGDFARRPRPAPSRDTSPAVDTGSLGAASGGSASAGSVESGGLFPAEAPGEPAPGTSKNEGLSKRAEPATVFCETEVKVQVLLPPPYNTLLPWRLVRALLGKLLSTTVAYVLPRFLDVSRSGCKWSSRRRGDRGRGAVPSRREKSMFTERCEHRHARLEVAATAR